ncbi:SLC13 family permease [Thermodesulfobacteriota bacterium]
MDAHHAEAAVVFGFDPLWLSTIILIVTYAVLLSEKFHRTVVALLGAGVMIIAGVLTQDLAFTGIDWNTIALLTGMMMIVGITRKTGVFEFVAIWSAKKVKADPLGVLIALSIVTAVFSAFLDNLTTVLLVVPVALLIADKLDVSPYPFLFSQILASNVGGTATLIGDPPNILIGSATGLTFTQFLFTLGPVSVILMPFMVVVFYFLWGKSLVTTPERRERIMQFKESDSITDKRLLKQSLTILALVIAGFIIGEHYHIRPGTTAMMGAAVLLFVASIGASHKIEARRLHEAFGEVEWGALFFFMGLFVVVHGVEHAGLLTLLGEKMMVATGGDLAVTAYATLWISAVVSTLLDNIPFVATMIPLVKSMAPGLGGTEMLTPLWWSLALGACLGGNGSLIGAAANVMVAGLGERAGHPISFFQFFKFGFPIMLFSIIIAHLYLYLRFFM